MFSFFIKQLFFLTSFLLFGYVIGRIILRNFSFSSLEEACVFSITIGWGFLAVLLMFLGFSGLFQPFIFLTILIIVFLACFYFIIPKRSSDFKQIKRSFRDYLASPYTILVLLFFALLFYLSLYPITEWDAISYHLPVAKEFILQGKIAATPFMRFPVNPQLIDLFFALALILNDPLFANLISCAMAIVLFLLIYSFGKRFLHKEIGLFSAFLFLSSPFVLTFALIPYAEIGATLFCFSAFYAMCIWFNENKLSYAILSAIFWGLAFGSKYYSIPFFFVSFLAGMVIYNKKVKFYQAVSLISLAVLIAFPWYFRNKIYSGDWFFPMRAIPGFWDPLDVSSHLNYMRSFGMGKGLQSLFMLPVNLLRHSDAFQGNIGLFIIGLGSVFFVKKWSRLISLCTTIFIIYGFIWFYSFQIMRYLFPVFPILSLLAGWMLQQVNDYLNLKKKLFWIFLIIAVLFLGCFNCAKIIKNNGLLPVTAGQQSEYIERRTPTFRAISFLNNIGQNRKVVYALLDEGSVFYYKNKVMGDWFGLAAYKMVLPYLDKPDILHQVLTNYGAQYFLIHRKKWLHISQTLFESHLFKLLYSDREAYVFELL